MKQFVTILVLTLSIITNAQDYKRTQNWYFGDSAGLSFATDPPTVLTDGAMSTIEGCATMSDTNGNLLFYTNGVTVWNRNHQVMDNGTDLYGNVTSTQSALIVPWPDNDSLYYIFTTDAVGQWKGLQYSLVNMNENSGLGKVIIKNILLHTPVCEKLTATHHQNGRDIWVMAHEFNSNRFLTYLVTKNGIIDCPVVTSIGSVHGGLITDAQGMMKFSPSGKLLAITAYWKNLVEIYDFDKRTGKVFDPIVILGFLLPYGLEFSENEKYLYITSRDRNLVQADISLKDADTINSQKTSIYYGTYSYPLQIGVNGKIYSTNGDSLFLSVINFPDSGGGSSDFLYTGISLPGMRSQYGLPNFITSNFYKPDLDFIYKASCINDNISFEGKAADLLVSPKWSIFKSSVLIHSNTQPSFSFTFSETGEYKIQLIANGDTITKSIFIEPRLNIGNDTLLCNQSSFEISIQDNFRCINWQDGSDSQYYTITESGIYYVSAYNGRGCLLTDSINVLFSSIPKPQIARNGDMLYVDSGDYQYQWYFNDNPVDSNKHYLIARNTGQYKVKITNAEGCISVSNVFNVNALSVQLFENIWFNIYPNPSKQGNEIRIESDELISDLIVTDVIGKIIFKQQNINQNQYQFHIQKKGLYILNINETHNYKLMIE